HPPPPPADPAPAAPESAPPARKTATRTASTGTSTRRKTSASASKTSTGGKASAASKAAAVSAPEALPAPVLPWYRMDLHLHTPASHDYEQPEMGYIGILRQAEKRGLSIIAFTDHNTVYGYRNMKREIADLEMLERLNRIHPDELGKLTEYRRLLKKVLVLPGFEFTATFGFHILGIFPPDKPIRDIESILMQLRVPGQAIDLGLSEAGATSDVLTAYRMIADGGGIAIAAHANSTNGVSMRDMDFGGQTRIAYTQDPFLHAIEWTDLDRGRRSSSTLLTGIRQEYPRRMHALQGSDAHRINVAPSNPKRLGIGERTTEVQLNDASFAALKALLQSQEWERVRPAFDILDVPAEAQKVTAEPAASASQAYHEALGKKATDRFAALVKDVCAMLNGSGGKIVLGAEAPIVEAVAPEKPTKSRSAKAAPKRKMPGVKSPDDVAADLGDAIQKQIYPAPQGVTILADVLGEADILRVSVPSSKAMPHVIDEVCYVRDNTESRIAKRDELVAMVKKAFEAEGSASRVPTSNPAAMAASQHARASHPQSHRAPTQHGQSGNGSNGVPQNQGSAGQSRNGNPSPRPPQNQAPAQPQRNTRDGQAAPVAQGGNARPAQNPPPRSPMPPRRRDDAPVVQAAPIVPAAPQAAPMVTVKGEQIETVSISDELNAMASEALSAAVNTPATAPAPSDNGEAQARVAQGIIAVIAAPREMLPKSGVEIALMEQRDDMQYFAVRDMRNGGITRNVTVKSARDLWHYAILKYNAGAYAADKIGWQGDRAVLGRAERAGKIRYDLALRTGTGVTHIFYGVVMDGLDSTWKALMNAHNAAYDSAQAADNAEPDESANDSLDSPVEVGDVAADVVAA
ncbi:MAG: putative DNA binding domain-containing protein, partial [Anaerolineae bacterium]|nr:putative DNA binding domain-containing protein [Anaerolineae bacterium]